MNLFSTTAKEIGAPYWWEDGAPLPQLSSELPSKAQLLIVGAGYTGLSAAIAASDAGVKVIVVDAGVPGHGASTRNGGMFGAHPRLAFDRLAKQFDRTTAAGIFNEAQDAFDFSCDLIRKENIKCHFDQCGRVQLAWTKAHATAQRKQVNHLRSVSNMNVEYVEQNELASEINTPCYFGAIRFPDHASLQPRLFHDGLLMAVLQRNIQVIQQCPIEHIKNVGSEYIATSASGQQLCAEKVLMATNGYTKGKFEWFARRVFPLPSFLIATEPLSPNLLQSLAPGKRMMVETRARHSYFRLSPDGTRIIFGGRASMTPISNELASYRLKQTMCEIWPQLSDVKLTHSWCGNTGYSFTHLPQVGDHEGMHFSMGYSGSGVALAPYLGAKAAYQAIGDSRGETAYQESYFKTKWFHRSYTPHFLKPANFWYKNAVDLFEIRAAKRDRNSN